MKRVHQKAKESLSELPATTAIRTEDTSEKERLDLLKEIKKVKKQWEDN